MQKDVIINSATLNYGSIIPLKRIFLFFFVVYVREKENYLTVQIGGEKNEKN